MALPGSTNNTDQELIGAEMDTGSGEEKRKLRAEEQGHGTYGTQPQNNLDSCDGTLTPRKKREEITQSSEELLVQSQTGSKCTFTKGRFSFRQFKYYYRHPYFRLFVAYFVVLCNFLIYAEDPVAHSYSGCEIPLIGNDYAFVIDRYPPGGFSALKFFLWFIAIILALIFGKLVIHRLVLRKLFKLTMFANDQGSWMVMFFVTLLCLFIFSFIFNAFLSLGGTKYAPYKITSYMGIQNQTFMKAAALGTWMGDFVTAWMVTDMMLQETSKYPNWANKFRSWWKGWTRVIAFWVMLLVLSTIVAVVVITDFVRWDKINRDFVYTNELGRGILASFILVLDFTIVMQDWDFPSFENDFDVKLPGLNTAHIHFTIPDCLKKEHWSVHISGKWFNYGILLIVMLLDLNMWKNQIFYKPYDFGQYTGPDDRIYSVKDTLFIKNKNTTTLSYNWRWTHINPRTNATFGSEDLLMNSRFRKYSLGVKSVAFLPSLGIIIAFGLLIWIFGRDKANTSVESQPITITNIKITKEKDETDARGGSFEEYPDGHKSSVDGDSNAVPSESEASRSDVILVTSKSDSNKKNNEISDTVDKETATV